MTNEQTIKQQAETIEKLKGALEEIVGSKDYTISCNVGVELFSGRTHFGEMQWEQTKLEDIRNIAKQALDEVEK